MATDIRAYLQQHETKSLLRFITCGSVDDGKSTLIGRLLHDTKGLFDDQLATLENLEGRNADDAVLLSKCGLFVYVYLDDFDLVAVFGRDVVKNRGNLAAWATPFGPEVD